MKKEIRGEIEEVTVAAETWRIRGFVDGMMVYQSFTTNYADARADLKEWENRYK